MTARSARGLFLATGKQGKVERPREENDFYPTPPEPTRAFLRAEIGHLRHPVWEPACGDLMRWKIDFTGAGAPPMLNGWFVWDRRHHGETVLRMLDRADDARQGALL